jgi:hypothetical protein
MQNSSVESVAEQLRQHKRTTLTVSAVLKKRRKRRK